MTEKPGKGQRISFGPFQADLAAGELRKAGRRVRLQEQPFQVLAALLERPGEAVTRDELRQRLWPDATFVDFDQGLNTAINKLRDALGDSAANPRFVETLPRRGYRFTYPLDAATAASGSDWRKTALVALVAATAAAIVTLSFRDSESPRPEPPTRRWSFNVRDLQFRVAGEAPVAISPNGRQIAYATKGSLWIRDLDSETSRRLEGTEGMGIYGTPAWSPDSEFIAFHTPERISKIAAAGGPPTTLCELTLKTHPWQRLSWSTDGSSIVFASGSAPRTRLFEVSAQGGAARLLLEDFGGANTTSFLPTPSRRVLLYSRGLYESELVVFSFDSGEQLALGRGALPHYSPSGHVVFQSGLLTRGLWALPFSAEGLRATGKAFPIVRDGRSPSVSNDGTLVYAENTAPRDQLILLDRGGKTLGPAGRPQPFISQPTFSPDGRRIAVKGGEDETGYDIWIHEVDRPMKTRLTTHDGMDLMPVWSPSGERVAFSSDRAGRRNVHAKDVDSDEEAQLLFAASAMGQWPMDWSPDGNHLALERTGDAGAMDLWYLERNIEGDYEAKPIRRNRFIEQSPAFSPDGRFVAFASDRSGRFEVYVCSFPRCTDVTQVSVNGGRQPRWAKKQEGLYFVESNDSMMEAAISTHPRVEVGAPRNLFTSPYLYVPGADGRSWFYDVSDDGERFVVVEPSESAGEGSPALVHVWQNWAAAFAGH